MKPVKCCANCQKGSSLYLTKDILCKTNGVVTSDYVCFKYKGQPELVSPKQMNFKCFHCDYFIVDIDSKNEHIGQCKLFSTREFDGRTRNACSKFSKKMLIEVS